MTSDELLERLDSVERGLRVLGEELEELRALARATSVAETGPAPPPSLRTPIPSARVDPASDWWQDERGKWHRGARADVPAGAVQPPAPAPAPAPKAARPAPPEPPREPSLWRRDVELADLFGPQALAWAGGIVTLLGIVFLFVLAVNRGWIGPEERVALGAAASAALFGAGFWIRRRYGDLHSALAAVGAGVAGGYATLLAAVALYDLLPKGPALLVAAAIAGLGLAVALAWSSETVAALGLVGAMVVPGTLVLQGGLTTIGTAFVAVVFAATAVVAIRYDWRELLWIGAAASAPQVAIVVADAGPGTHPSLIVVAASFWLLYLGAGIAYQRVVLGEGLGRLATTFVLLATTFAAPAAAKLFDGTVAGVGREGLALLAAAAAQGALSLALFRRAESRQLSLLLGVAALVLAGLAAADLLSGQSLTYTWAAEGALLVWLAARTREIRFQLGGLAYLGLALGHALAFEAAPDHLFTPNGRPAEGIPQLVAVALAALVAARAARVDDAGELERDSGVLSAFDQAFAELARRQLEVRTALAGAVGVLASYAASLGVLGLFELSAESVERAFDHGHVAVTALWAAAGLAAVSVGLFRSSRRLTDGGLLWLVVTLFKTFAYDGSALSPELRSYAFLAAGAAILLGGYLFELYDARYEALTPLGIAAALVSLGMAVASVWTLVEGHVAGVDARGLALLAVAAAYALPAAWAFRAHRDLSTLHWGVALGVTAAADAQLLGGSWRVLGWSAAAAAAAGLAVVSDERRFRLASVGFLALALATTLSSLAPPADLFVANRHPASGVPAIAFVAVALLVFGLLTRRRDDDAHDERGLALWGAALLALYGASLTLLGLSEALGSDDVKESFQRGHAAVSALWGSVGVALLYAGLRRGSRGLRLGGLALLAVSLGKLFVYDLAQLSSVTRALSFLAVGAVLLLGGFFYQRLSAQLGERA